jgi:dolichyl-phosphate-mannose-protein mannosyltransferase
MRQKDAFLVVYQLICRQPMVVALQCNMFKLEERDRQSARKVGPLRLEHPSHPPVPPRFLISGRAFRTVILGVLFAAACALRVYKIKLLPLEFHPTRQYHSALIAKSYYYQSLKSIPEWKKQIAALNEKREAFFEPRILEHLAAFAYRVKGEECIWIPRLLSSIFWLVGGAFVYRVAKRLTSPNAALFSTGYYLFLPFGVVASRSFQPDPLMIMLLLVSLHALFLYHEGPSRQRFAMVVTAAALAMLVKLVCLFVILGAFISLSLCKWGFRATIKNSRSWMFAAFAFAPSLIIYPQAMLTSGVQQWQVKSSFIPHLFAERSYWGLGGLLHLMTLTVIPHLFLERSFWVGWVTMIYWTVGLVPFIVAVVGILIARQGLPRALLIGLWTGYLAFGLAFNYHISTHNYYQLQFIPIVALSLASVADAVLKQLPSPTEAPGRGRAGYAAILLLGTTMVVWYVSEAQAPLSYANRDQMTIAQAIGERVNHTGKALLLSRAYGNLLKYHGELSGIRWPWRDEMQIDSRWLRLPTVEERFQELNQEFSPEYFIVTDMPEYRGQPTLQEFLTKTFPLLVQDDQYLIFDLRRRLSPNP